MIRGTTPLHTFKLPTRISNVVEFDVRYAQKEIDNVILTKHKDDFSVRDEYTYSIRLTEAETLAFKAKDKSMLQIRVKTSGGNVFRSPQYNFVVKDIIGDE